MGSLSKIVAIIILSFCFFSLEFLIFNLLAPWCVPNLLLILIVFFDFFLGIRYGLLTAVVCGLLKDSFNIDIFGGYFLSFVACAYMATVFRRYVYYSGVTFRRILTVISVVIVNFSILYALQVFKGPVRFWDAFWHVLIPEMFCTLLVTNMVFKFLRRCVSRLSV